MQIRTIILGAFAIAAFAGYMATGQPTEIEPIEVAYVKPDISLMGALKSEFLDLRAQAGERREGKRGKHGKKKDGHRGKKRDGKKYGKHHGGKKYGDHHGKKKDGHHGKKKRGGGKKYGDHHGGGKKYGKDHGKKKKWHKKRGDKKYKCPPKKPPEKPKKERKKRDRDRKSCECGAGKERMGIYCYWRSNGAFAGKARNCHQQQEPIFTPVTTYGPGLG